MLDASLPRPHARRLRTLGHALVRLHAGTATLAGRLRKDPQTSGLPSGWLDRWGLDRYHAPALPVRAQVRWSAHEWHVTEPMADHALPDAWITALLALHLPALRIFWRKELRAARFDRLQRVLPRVWPVDPAPLPPGATISGLGLASWDDLPRLLATGRAFEAGALSGEKETVTAQNWPQFLVRAASEPIVLIERRHLADSESLTLTWDADENGWISLC